MSTCLCYMHSPRCRDHVFSSLHPRCSGKCPAPEVITVLIELKLANFQHDRQPRPLTHPLACEQDNYCPQIPACVPASIPCSFHSFSPGRLSSFSLCWKRLHSLQGLGRTSPPLAPAGPWWALSSAGPQQIHTIVCASWVGIVAFPSC